MQGVQHRGDKIARVQRPRLARLEIDLYTVLLLHPGDAGFQRRKVIARAGDVVSAAEVEPLQARQQAAELRLDRVQRQGQRVGVLLTEGVEVEAVQQGREARLLFQRGIPLGAGGAEAAARGAGVIDGMALLRRALGVDAQAHALARSLCRRAELCQLGGGVEDDVVGVVEQLGELVHPVGGAEDVVLLLGQLLPAQTALVEAAGLRARQIGREEGVEVEVGEGLLGQQHLAARPLLDAQQDLAVAAQLGLVQQVAGGGQGSEGRFGEVCQPGEGRACIEHPHQSTRAGLWLSERGRPYLSRASR